MKVIATIFILTLAAVSGHSLPDNDLRSQIEGAKKRFDNDFLLGVWYRSNEAIVDSRENLLRLYTHYTIEQSEEVVNQIAKYRQLTLTEASEKRDKALSGKNITNVFNLIDCIFKNEDSTIQAYKMTGYNLHNCIRMAQIETETRYLEILKNFEQIKNASMEKHNYYSDKVENCLDKMCVVGSLISSVVEYEKLQDEIATNTTEINGVNTKYLLNHIALGCVSNSIVQIKDNYKIGKELVNDCYKKDPADSNPSHNSENV